MFFISRRIFAPETVIPRPCFAEKTRKIKKIMKKVFAWVLTSGRKSGILPEVKRSGTFFCPHRKATELLRLKRSFER